MGGMSEQVILTQGRFKTLWTEDVIDKIKVLVESNPKISSVQAHKTLVDDGTLHWKPRVGVFRIYCSRYKIRFNGYDFREPKYLQFMPDRVRSALKEAAEVRDMHWHDLTIKLLTIACDDKMIDNILDDLPENQIGRS